MHADHAGPVATTNPVSATTPPSARGLNPPGRSAAGRLASRHFHGVSGGDRPATPRPVVTLRHVSVAFGRHQAVRDVSLDVATHRVTALVGPSGCGKTTVLRTVNRLHDHLGGTVRGSVRVGDVDVYARDTQPELIRAKVGMVFQRPNLFPTMSIFENAVSGLRLNGVRRKSLLAEAAEAALRQAALWDTVKDRLGAPGVGLSGGQQQRLCMARALAIEPEILLLDEPCSALDPIATARIERLISQLASSVSIVLVTHNMFQAARVSDFTAVFLLADDGVGELVEAGPTVEVFNAPTDPRTEAYVTGHVG